MPRRKKSKARGGDKPHGDKPPQAQGKTQSCGGAQATAAAEEESTTSSPQCEGVTQSLPDAQSCSTSQEPERIPAITTSAVFSCTRSSEAFDGQYKHRVFLYEVPPFTETPGTDCLTRKASLLEQYLLYRYKMKQLIMKEDILKIIHESHHDRLAEILKRASERIELVFAVDLKEVDSVVPCYNLVSKLKLPNNGRVRGGRGFPKTGLLMNLLGMIFMKGNCAAEEDIWKSLGTMGVYAGRKHFVFGEPRKLITKDLVRLKYLEYRQVANSDPPRYEFLWGPKAHLETSKMKVLEFLAKVNNAVPTDFPTYYEEALRDEEKAQGMDAAKPDATIKVSTPPRDMLNIVFPPVMKNVTLFPRGMKI
nr:melanoma-associated antigen B5-like [Odocoileus virginianus texanus]XP_020728529.1 melanoma-associated antigen B5-like [Odocoileus virginianus texanus]